MEDSTGADSADSWLQYCSIPAEKEPSATASSDASPGLLGGGAVAGAPKLWPDSPGPVRTFPRAVPDLPRNVTPEPAPPGPAPFMSLIIVWIAVELLLDKSGQVRPAEHPEVMPGDINPRTGRRFEDLREWASYQGFTEYQTEELVKNAKEHCKSQLEKAAKEAEQRGNCEQGSVFIKCPLATGPSASALPSVQIPPVTLPCFETDRLPSSKFSELDRQLQNQEAAINKMTVEEYLKRRQEFERLGRLNEAEARSARLQFQEELMIQILNEYLFQGMRPDLAQARAEIEAAQVMKELAALHDPDQVVAGSELAGWGDRRVNSTIGSQWKRPVDIDGKSTTRVQEMDRAAKAVPASERAATKMNVRLSRCK